MVICIVTDLAVEGASSMPLLRFRLVPRGGTVTSNQSTPMNVEIHTLIPIVDFKDLGHRTS